MDECRSRYGVRNLVGNVSEWLADTMSCTEVTPGVDATCSLITPLGTVGAGRDDSNTADNQMALSYGFLTPNVRGQVGLMDIDNQRELVSYGTLETDRMHLAVGWPFLETVAPLTVMGAPRISGTTSLPSTLGSNFFGGDTLLLYFVTDTTADPNTQYALLHGGSFESSSGAGRFTMELIPQQYSDIFVGHRCVIRLTPSP